MHRDGARREIVGAVAAMISSAILGGSSHAEQDSRRTGRVAVTLLAIMLGLAVASSIQMGRPAVSVLPALPFYIAGWVILHRVGSHPIGWLLYGIGVILQVTAFASLPWLTSFWINWLQAWGFAAMFAMFTWLFILFPDGVASRRWRTVGWTASALVLGGVLTPTVTDISDSAVTLGINPTGLSWLPMATGAVSTMAITGLLIVAAVGVVVRGRRAALELRPRYKPVLATMAVLGVFIVGLLAALIIDPTFTDVDRYGGLVWPAALVVYMLIPISFGVAITRYRLYDIDRVLSRTVTYGLVAVVLGAIYVIPVVTLPSLIHGSSDLIVAGSTLGAAVAFNPVRKRIQHAVDRRFNRSHWDFENEVDTLSDRLRSELTVDAVEEAIDDVLSRTLQPTRAGIWIRGSST